MMCFFRKPFMNIEMHHCMIGENSLLDAYYEDIWKRARQEEGKSHIYRLSWEDFLYLYDRSYGETFSGRRMRNPLYRRYVAFFGSDEGKSGLGLRSERTGENRAGSV